MNATEKVIKSLIGEKIHLLEKTTIEGELCYDGTYSVNGCTFNPSEVLRIVVASMQMYVPIVVLR